MREFFRNGDGPRWIAGRARMRADFDLYARAGNVDNPQRAWSDWKKVTPNVGPLGLWMRRGSCSGKRSCMRARILASVGMNYLPVNVAPVVDEIVVVPGRASECAGMQLPAAAGTDDQLPCLAECECESVLRRSRGREPLPRDEG